MQTKLTRMLEDEKSTRDKLKAKRNRLFQRFLDNPENIGLALKIKVIDDRVAEYTQMEGKQKA
jgi:hypothetical protein